MLHLWPWFYYGKKNTNQNKPEEETCRVRSGRVPNTKLPCCIPVESAHVALPVHQCVNYTEHRLPGKLTWDLVSGVFVRASACRHNWLNHWPHDWTQFSAPFLLQRLGWYHVAQRIKPQITLSVFLAWLAPALSHPVSTGVQWPAVSHVDDNINCYISAWVADTPITWEGWRI